MHKVVIFSHHHFTPCSARILHAHDGYNNIASSHKSCVCVANTNFVICEHAN